MKSSILKKQAEILAFIEENRRAPSQLAKTKVERNLYSRLRSYSQPQNSKKFPEFNRALVETLSQVGVVRQPFVRFSRAKSQAAIFAFINKNGRKPTVGNLASEKERVLAKRMGQYCAPTSQVYDPEFKKALEALEAPNALRARKLKTQQQIIDFIVKNKRAPMARDRKDASLRNAFYMMTSARSMYFDRDFTVTVNNLLNTFGLSVRNVIRKNAPASLKNIVGKGPRKKPSEID